MAIIFDNDKKIFALQTQHATYMMGIVDNRYLGHIYYGRQIAAPDGGYLMRTEEPPFVPSINKREKCSFLDAFPMEYPCGGVGDYRESCLEIRNYAGYRGCEFFYQDYAIKKGKPKLDGLPAVFGTEENAETLEITLADDVLKLELVLSYSIFADSDVVARSARLRNVGEEPVYVEKMYSACLDMDDRNFEMLTLHGSWARERQMERRPLGHGKQMVSSVRGESSHQEHPFLALVTPETTQQTGEVYGMHFVYSGNFAAQVELTQFDAVRMTMGIHSYGFEWKLNPGESFTAPETILVYSADGLGGMTRTLHDLYRNHLIRSPYLHRERPILINNWEATYFDFDADKLVDIAREAKRCGIEMLVMDDGWFGKRNSDNCSLGDWQVDRNKLPDGLSALVDRVKDIGLSFGIWFEPEMISPDSDLYREHPDYAIQIPGREASESRQQYVLDLSRPEIVDYVYGMVSDVLKSADISYVKWDMNRQLSDVGSFALESDRQGELFHRYVLGVYRMQERLLADFPDLLLENCSGGGARFDPGMLYYSPQIWCSDDTDAVERLSIQEGTALLYPLSTMGAHVSDCPNHTVGRTTPFETRGNVALAGTFGYELDITKISEEDRAMIKTQTEMYHKYHELVREGDYYRIDSYRENHTHDCWQVVSKDKTDALVTYVQVMGEPNYHSRRIYLQGLCPERRYRLEENGREYAGDLLMYGGFLIERPFGDAQSKLYHFVCVD
ncbi:MAG: alpha-galactosidase [Clostridium sp.]|nr:alpha-galactosidase [Clostridium sp.]